jgi:hypothetical protein
MNMKSPVRVLGVMPGTNPPELAWHEFKEYSDGVEHWIGEELRASIPQEHFEEYLQAQNSVVFPGDLLTPAP